MKKTLWGIAWHHWLIAGLISAVAGTVAILFGQWVLSGNSFDIIVPMENWKTISRTMTPPSQWDSGLLVLVYILTYGLIPIACILCTGGYYLATLIQHQPILKNTDKQVA